MQNEATKAIALRKLKTAALRKQYASHTNLKSAAAIPESSKLNDNERTKDPKSKIPCKHFLPKPVPVIKPFETDLARRLVQSRRMEKYRSAPSVTPTSSASLSQEESLSNIATHPLTSIPFSDALLLFNDASSIPYFTDLVTPQEVFEAARLRLASSSLADAPNEDDGDSASSFSTSLLSDREETTPAWKNKNALLILNSLVLPALEQAGAPFSMLLSSSDRGSQWPFRAVGVGYAVGFAKGVWEDEIALRAKEALLDMLPETVSKTPLHSRTISAGHSVTSRTKTRLEKLVHEPNVHLASEATSSKLNTDGQISPSANSKSMLVTIEDIIAARIAPPSHGTPLVRCLYADSTGALLHRNMAASILGVWGLRQGAEGAVSAVRTIMDLKSWEPNTLESLLRPGAHRRPAHRLTRLALSGADDPQSQLGTLSDTASFESVPNDLDYICASPAKDGIELVDVAKLPTDRANPTLAYHSTIFKSDILRYLVSGMNAEANASKHSTQANLAPLLPLTRPFATSSSSPQQTTAIPVNGELVWLPRSYRPKHPVLFAVPNWVYSQAVEIEADRDDIIGVRLPTVDTAIPTEVAKHVFPQAETGENLSAQKASENQSTKTIQRRRCVIELEISSSALANEVFQQYVTAVPRTPDEQEAAAVHNMQGLPMTPYGREVDLIVAMHDINFVPKLLLEKRIATLANTIRKDRQQSVEGGVASSNEAASSTQATMIQTDSEMRRSIDNAMRSVLSFRNFRITHIDGASIDHLHLEMDGGVRKLQANAPKGLCSGPRSIFPMLNDAMFQLFAADHLQNIVSRKGSNPVGKEVDKITKQLLLNRKLSALLVPRTPHSQLSYMFASRFPFELLRHTFIKAINLRAEEAADPPSKTVRLWRDVRRMASKVWSHIGITLSTSNNRTADEKSERDMLNRSLPKSPKIQLGSSMSRVEAFRSVLTHRRWLSGLNSDATSLCANSMTLKIVAFGQRPVEDPAIAFLSDKARMVLLKRFWDPHKTADVGTVLSQQHAYQEALSRPSMSQSDSDTEPKSSYSGPQQEQLSRSQNKNEWMHTLCRPEAAQQPNNRVRFLKGESSRHGSYNRRGSGIPDDPDDKRKGQLLADEIWKLLRPRSPSGNQNYRTDELPSVPPYDAEIHRVFDQNVFRIRVQSDEPVELIAQLAEKQLRQLEHTVTKLTTSISTSQTTTPSVESADGWSRVEVTSEEKCTKTVSNTDQLTTISPMRKFLLRQRDTTAVAFGLSVGESLPLSVTMSPMWAVSFVHAKMALLEKEAAAERSDGRMLLEAKFNQHFSVYSSALLSRPRAGTSTWEKGINELRYGLALTRKIEPLPIPRSEIEGSKTFKFLKAAVDAQHHSDRVNQLKPVIVTKAVSSRDLINIDERVSTGVAPTMTRYADMDLAVKYNNAVPHALRKISYGCSLFDLGGAGPNGSLSVFDGEDDIQGFGQAFVRHTVAEIATLALTASAVGTTKLRHDCIVSSRVTGGSNDKQAKSNSLPPISIIASLTGSYSGAMPIRPGAILVDYATNWQQFETYGDQLKPLIATSAVVVQGYGTTIPSSCNITSKHVHVWNCLAKTTTMSVALTFTRRHNPAAIAVPFCHSSRYLMKTRFAFDMLFNSTNESDDVTRIDPLRHYRKPISGSVIDRQSAAVEIMNKSTWSLQSDQLELLFDTSFRSQLHAQGRLQRGDTWFDTIYHKNLEKPSQATDMATLPYDSLADAFPTIDGDTSFESVTSRIEPYVTRDYFEGPFWKMRSDNATAIDPAHFVSNFRQRSCSSIGTASKVVHSPFSHANGCIPSATVPLRFAQIKTNLIDLRGLSADRIQWHSPSSKQHISNTAQNLEGVDNNDDDEPSFFLPQERRLHKTVFDIIDTNFSNTPWQMKMSAMKPSREVDEVNQKGDQQCDGRYIYLYARLGIHSRFVKAIVLDSILNIGRQLEALNMSFAEEPKKHQQQQQPRKYCSEGNDSVGETDAQLQLIMAVLDGTLTDMLSSDMLLRLVWGPEAVGERVGHHAADGTVAANMPLSHWLRQLLPSGELKNRLPMLIAKESAFMTAVLFAHYAPDLWKSCCTNEADNWDAARHVWAELLPIVNELRRLHSDSEMLHATIATPTPVTKTSPANLKDNYTHIAASDLLEIYWPSREAGIGPTSLPRAYFATSYSQP